MKNFAKYFMLGLMLASLGLGFAGLQTQKNALAMNETSPYNEIVEGDSGSSGTGTAADPYLISTATMLASFAEKVNSGEVNVNAKLVTSIDIGGKIWTPIGNSEHPYIGTFDGDGYAIENLLIDSTMNLDYSGLFGRVSSGTIQNLVVKNAFIVNAASNLGILIGNVTNATLNSLTLQNICITGGFIKYTGSNTAAATSAGVGSFIGRLVSGTTIIQNSYSDSMISTPGSDNDYTKKICASGIVGFSSGKLSVYNTYFTGEVDIFKNYVTYNPISYSSSYSIPKYNVYYAYKLGLFQDANNGITYTNYAGYYDYGSSISSSTLSMASNQISYPAGQLASLITGIDINAVFTKATSDDICLKAQDNWIKTSNAYPILRGVGNVTMAIKELYPNYQDYAETDGVRVNSVPLDYNGSFLISYTVNSQDMTWQKISKYRKMSGMKSNLESIATNTNSNRLTESGRSNTVTLAVSSPTRQSYYTYEITNIKMLHRRNVSLSSLATKSSLAGTLYFYNVDGELYLNTTQANWGTKYDIGSYATLSYSGTNVSIFTTTGTTISVNAVSSQNADFYNDIYVDSTSDCFSRVSDYQFNCDYISPSQTTTLSVYLSDLYKLNFDSTYIFNGYNNYGGRLAVNNDNIYISYTTNKIYNPSTSNSHYYTQNLSVPYPVPTATGLEFVGWYTGTVSNDIVEFKDQFSKGSGVFGIATYLQTIPTNFTKSTYVENGMTYQTSNSLMLFAKWQYRKNTINYSSYLNLEDKSSDFWASGWTSNSEIAGAFADFYQIPDQETMVNVNSGEYSSSGTFGTITSSVPTEQEITISRSMDGNGYGLKAIVLAIPSGNPFNQAAYSDMNFGENMAASFVSDMPSPWSAIWYKELADGVNSVTIYHIHSDLMIFAIYDRGTGSITAKFNISKPEGAQNIGLSINYSICEINGELITENQTLTESESIITGLKAGQNILINSMALSNSNFAFSYDGQNRIVVDPTVGENTEDAFAMSIIYDNEVGNKWVIRDLVPTMTTFFNTEVSRSLLIYVRYAGLTFNLKAGYYDNGVIKELTTNTDPFPSLSMAYSAGSQPIIDSVENRASNVKQDTELKITVLDQKLWQVLSSSNIAIEDTQTGVFVDILDLTLEKESSISYILKNFSGFNELVNYNIYILMDKTPYTIDIIKNENTDKIDITAKVDNNAKTLTFELNKASIVVYFDSLVEISFNINDNGYQIKNITMLSNTISDATKVASYDYSFRLSEIDPNANIVKTAVAIPLTVTVEPKATSYKIEYYQESLNDQNVFEKVEEETISGVYVGDQVTVSTSKKSYFGFSYVSNENEVLTAKITYDQDNLTVFKIFYERKTYQISYNGNASTGGVAPETQQIRFGHSFNLQTNTFEKTGFNFASWNTKSNASGNSYTQNEQITLNADFATSAAIVLYAIWQEKTIEVIYSATDVDNYSSSWSNISGYTTFADQKYALAIATYSKVLGYLNKTTYSTLPIPTKVGYDFLGWFTSLGEDGTQVTASTIVNFTDEMTFYAKFQRQTVSVMFNLNLSCVNASLSYTTKTLNVGDKFTSVDAITGLNLGFPVDSWTSTKAFNLKGWALVSSPSGSVSYLTNQSTVTASQSTIYVYAHWEVVSAVISTAANWASVVTYNGEAQRTLQIGSSSSFATYITNYSSASGLTYGYSWYKDGAIVNGQTTSSLYLTNVSQSGQYLVKVVVSHSIWGSSTATSSGLGTVTIEKAPLTVSATLTSGFISKKYDAQTTVNGVTTSNSSILKAVASYDNANVGTNKVVTFTLTYISGDPNNYSVSYKGSIIENSSNLTSFSFEDNTAEITKYNLSVNIGSLSDIVNGTKHRVQAASMTISSADSSFLSSRGQKLSGYVETSDAIANNYTGSGLVSFLQIVTLDNTDMSQNYNVTILGNYELIEGVLKTLIISKQAILDKESQQIVTTLTPSFVIRYGANDISLTGVYNIGGYYFNVTNNSNSDEIVISTDSTFNGELTIIASTFSYLANGVTTQAVANKWIEENKDDILSSSIEYDFENIVSASQNTVTILYLNYSTIVYYSRLSETPYTSQTVYNTESGLTVTHPSKASMDQSGIDFANWYDSVLSTATVAPTIWKGCGIINLFAKWDLQTPDISMFDEQISFDTTVEKTYDAKSHSLSFVTNNQNAYIKYTYNWTINSQVKSTTSTFDYKDATTLIITLTVTAKLFYGTTLDQTENVVKTINLTVNKFNYNYTDIIEKVYDGTSQIKSGVGDYVLVDPLGTNLEFLKLTGLYETIYAGDNINLVSTVFSPYLSSKPSNYNITMSAKGKITPLDLKDVNIGSDTDNQKVYDGTEFVKTKENVVSSMLVNGNILNITFKTTDKKAQVYTAEDNQIIVTSWSVFDGSLDITSSYNLVNIIGSAKITNYQIDMSKIILNDATFVYDAQEKYVYADYGAFENKTLPSGVSATYTYQLNGTGTIYSYETSAPKNVGIYNLTLTITADETNYTIIGNSALSSRIIITQRSATVNLGDQIYYGQGIKTIIVDTQSGTHLINNLPLIMGHYMTGSVSSSSNLPNTYSGENLISSLVIYDENANDVTSNYQITITGSITIIHYYFIAYNSNGGNGNITIQKVNYGENVYLSLNTFVKDGYIFSHWNTLASDKGTEYADRTLVSNLAGYNETITMYAIWAPSTSTKYYVEYYLQELDGTYSLVSYSSDLYTGTTENTIELVPTYQSETLVSKYTQNIYEKGALQSSTIYNKTFVGFSAVVTENSVLTGIVTPQSQGSLTLKLYYSRNTYTLTLNKNNYDNPSMIENTYFYGQSIEEPQTPTRAGYQFVGWFIGYPSPDMKQISWPYEMPANDVDLWAIYQANQNTPYSLEIYEQNIDGTYSQTPISTVNKSGQTDTYAFVELTYTETQITNAVLRVYTDSEKTTQMGTDYNIAASYTGFKLKEYELQVISGKITAETKLVLKIYYERNQYTFTKVFHNGESDAVTNCRYLETIPLPATPVYTGYVFDGWYSGYDSETGAYTNLITWPISITQNTTVYAKWKPSENTKYILNIYFETLAGTYASLPDMVSELKSTTNYFAEFSTVGSSNYIQIYTDSSKAVLKATEGTYNFVGFHIKNDLSTFTTQIKPDGSGIISIYFERDLYSVTFVYNNGDADSNSDIVKYQATIQKPTDPTWAGYIFANWYLDSNFTNPVTFPYSVVNNTTKMYAKWINATNTPYKIEIYKQDTSGNYPLTPIVDEYTGTTGHFIAMEKQLIGENYVWNMNEYTDNTKTTLVNLIKSIEITGYTYTVNGETIEKEILNDGSMIIKLYYTLNSYNFTINFNNGSDNEIQSVFFDQVPQKPTDPTNIGFVFSGYYSDALLSSPFDFASFKMPAYDYIVYAKWVPATNTPYEIGYYLQNLDLSYSAEPFLTANYLGTTNQYIVVENGQIVTYENSAKSTQIKQDLENSFIGFTQISNVNEILEGLINSNGTLVLKVYFSRNAYDITLYYNDEVTDQKLIENVLFEATVTEIVPKRAGYDFGGFYYESSLQTKVNWTLSGQSMSYIMEANNVSMYAKWSARNDTPFKVEHYRENANDSGFTLYETKDFIGVTDQVANASQMSYAGFTFDEANLNNVLSGTILGDGSLVLKVYYIRVIYNIKFNGNGNTSGTMENLSFKYGETKALSANNFARSGFEFIGWTDNSVSTTIKYANNASYTFQKTQDINLYALWNLSALTTVALSASSTNIYYGNTILLTASAETNALASVSYEWFKNGTKFANDSNTLQVQELSESGEYIVNIIIRATDKTGVVNSVANKLTNTVTVTINPRILIISFTGDSFVYNAQNQTPTYQINYYISGDITMPTRTDIVLPTSTSTIKQGENVVSKSVDAGNYELNVNVDLNDNYTLTGDTTHNYEITKLGWNISSQITEGEFGKNYAYPALTDPILQKDLTNSQTSETITITFTRQAGEDIGLYDLLIENNDYQNYVITLDGGNKGFAIKKAESGTCDISFADLLILTKIYDGQKIDTVTETSFALSNLHVTNNATLLSAKFEIKDNAKNVGSYQIILTSAETLEFGNVTMLNQYFFTITPRQINYAATTIEKYYDQNANFPSINFSNVLSEDISNILITGRFNTANAGTNIHIFASLLGSAKSNYTLSDEFNSLSGTILKEPIKVISDTSISYEYGVVAISIGYDAYGLNAVSGLYEEEIDLSQLSGNLGLNPQTAKLTVGNYQTTIGTLAVNTSNYEINEFVSGSVQITAKTLNAVADWNKIYDGTTNFTNIITLEGLVAGDDVVASAVYSQSTIGTATLTITLAGADIGNYILANNTATGNIEYKYVTAILNYAFDTLQTPEHSAPAEQSLNLIYNKTIKESGYASLPVPSATGYNFVNWCDESGNVYTENTLINNLIWAENESEKTLTARWSTGEVTITVNVITYSSKDYLLEDMTQNTLQGGTFTINGVSFETGSNTQNVGFMTNATIVAIPNADYDFVGFFTSSEINATAISTDTTFTVSDTTLTAIMNNNLVIFAKFKLKTAILTINTNSNSTPVILTGNFMNWEIDYQNGQIASVSKEFDHFETVTLPLVSEISRTGYTFQGFYLTNTPSGTDTPISSVTLNADTIVYAIWKANTYTVSFIASTGDEDESLLHSDKGHFANASGQITKSVEFEKAIGEIEEPARIRYTFQGWYDNDTFAGDIFTADSIYNFTESKTFYAKWTENTYTATINVSQFVGGDISVEESTGILSVTKTNTGSNKVIVVTLLASSELHLIASVSSGYKLIYSNSYTNGVDFVENSVISDVSANVTISRFAENFELSFDYKCLLYSVKLTVNNTNFGSANVSVNNIVPSEMRAEEIDDGSRITQSVLGNEISYEIKAFTGEKIDILMSAVRGYELASILLKTGNGQIENLTNTTASYSGFTQNSEINVGFVASENTVKVKVGQDTIKNIKDTSFGSFGLSIIDENSNETVIEENANLANVLSNVKIKTGEKLVIRLNANHGFKISENLSDYAFTPINEESLTGSFDLTDISNKTVILSGFNSDGEIVLPFVREYYSLKVKIAFLDESVINEITENAALFATTNILTAFDVTENENGYFYYQKMVNVSATSGYGYKILGYYGSLDTNSLFASGANISYTLLDNSTIYLVVERDTFTIKYEVSGNGNIVADSLTMQVKYQKDASPVTATAFAGYEFSHWEILNLETGLYEQDLVNLLASRQETNVTKNMTIRAVFIASKINVTFDSKYIADIDTSGNYIFSDEMSEDIGTMQIADTEMKGVGFSFETFTGNTIHVLATAKEGYTLKTWVITNGTAKIVLNSGNGDILIQGFTADFTITALFEANENEFDIAIARVYSQDYNFTSSQFVDGGIINIDPSLYLDTQSYMSLVKASVRTNQEFEITYFVLRGYNLIYDELNASNVKIGIRYDGTNEVVFADNMTVTDLIGTYTNEVTFTMSSFKEGGTIVLFVTVTTYPVTFHKTDTESKVFDLQIGSTFVDLDSEYRIPSRVGYNFEGWYSQANGQGVQYIDKKGITLKEWSIEHQNIYAYWTRAYVTFTVYCTPPTAPDGSLGWNVAPYELKQVISSHEFQYYVGIDTYFDAPVGKEGYEFAYWQQDNEIVSTDLHYFFNIPENETDIEQILFIIYKVRVSVSATEGGTATINGGNSVYMLTTDIASLVATAQDGYEFACWKNYQTGAVVSTNSEYEISNMTEVTTFVAMFVGKKVEIIIQSGEKGSISGWTINDSVPTLESGKYYARLGNELRFTTVPNSGYILTSYILNGVGYAKFEKYTITLADVNAGQITIKPVFTLIDINYEILYNTTSEVKVNNQLINSGKVFTTNYYDYITFTFTPAIRYKFASIYVNSTLLDASYITENASGYNVNIPASTLSMTSINKIYLAFDMLYWIELKSPFEGQGTEQNPYQITSAQNFAEMAYLINNNIAPLNAGNIEYASAYYTLTVSVDFAERFWIPIGTEENPFNGTITLLYSRKNIVLDKSYEVTALDGLFGYTTQSAQFIQVTQDISIAIIIISSVSGVLVIITVGFIIAIYKKRKRIREQSRLFPTERPTKKHK